LASLVQAVNCVRMHKEPRLTGALCCRQSSRGVCEQRLSTERPIELVAEAPHNRIGARGKSYWFAEGVAVNARNGPGAERVMTILYPNDPIGRNRPVDTAADIITACIRFGSLGVRWVASKSCASNWNEPLAKPPAT
jgi:hypothetical protein